MKRRLLLSAALLAFSVAGIQAQRVMDKLQRGTVAVKVGTGNFVSWRILGEEYYDTKYNLYRNGTLIAPDLTVSNYQDTGGNANATYQVEAVVKGVKQEKSPAVRVWSNDYMDVQVKPVVNRAGTTIGNSVAGNSGGADTTTPGYTLNDVSLADVDGDGVTELIVKRNNSQGNLRNSTNKTDFNLYECYKLDGTRLWWIDLGPNLMAGPDEQWDMIGYDWDQDGKAEVLMRGADNMIIHTSTGKTINVGDMNYYAPRDEYTHQGAEYLLYLNGETGEPWDWDGTSTDYTPMAYPLPRFEVGEAANPLNATSAEYAAVWGDADTGHRSCKHYFGAPYLDGRNPSIFLGRGCYTRHKACALDVDPLTHQLTQRWRWNCYQGGSPWFGNGFHNFAIADVDMDGRDEIVYGSMILDDTGYGLATSGLGHGDAQHCSDLDPYRWGLEQFTCQEGSQGNSYWNATTGEMYYRKADGGDDGRALAGNFTDLYPGSQGRSVSSGVISLTADMIVNTNGDAMSGSYANLNNRIYWDGDLLSEIFNSKNGANRDGTILKWGGQQIKSFAAITNNWTKCNPSAQGDILGDWREELVLRTADNNALRIYTTTTPTEFPIYTLWHDHVYRNGMAWQCVGYNQPPHLSYFLGNIEGITVAPPPVTLNGRTEVENGATISTTDQHLLVSGYEDKTINVAEGAAPYILTVNAPAWVKGTGSRQATTATPKSPRRDVVAYTTTLTGGAFSGEMRLVKQGEGILVLPKVTETYTGNTDVWNGTLVFDGTLQGSPLWLNRHTTLLTDGGAFMQGIKADYNATIYVGKDKQSTLTTTTLALGFGSRLVIDINGADQTADLVKANQMTVEQRTWEYGPKYSAPVIQFNCTGELSDGQYLIGEIGSITGNSSSVDYNDFILEGIEGKRHYLKYEEGKLYLVVETLRDGTTITWNGTSEDNTWDYGATENFTLANGTPTYNGEGDDVVFDDNAAYTTVNIKGSVKPKSVTFNNATKTYVLTGDSIVGAPTLLKTGKGALNVRNLNKLGNVTLQGGKLTAFLLANNTGQTLGSLGTVNSQISLGDGTTFAVSGVTITDQRFRVAGNTTIDVPSSTSLTLNKGILGSGTLNKTGAGPLTLAGQAQSFDTLVVSNGTVNANELNNVIQLPQTVVLNGGTLADPASEASYSTNNTNFVVPAGKTGTFYGDPRCEYHGTLTGNGTFIVYGTWVRCYYKGDWSQFEGTITPRVQDRSTKGGYTPTFDFQNALGLPKATLNLESGFTFYSANPIKLNAVTGSGTLGGSNAYTLGSNGGNITVSFSSTAPIIKEGDGYLRFSTAGKIQNSVTVNGGELQFNQTSLADLQHGSYTTTINNGGALRGVGLLNSLTVNAGGDVYPTGFRGSQTPGTLKTNALMRFNTGSTLHMVIRTASSYSKLQAKYLKMMGTVAVELLDNYTPAKGQSFTLWEVSTTVQAGVPNIVLPELPAGLFWDTSELVDATGKPLATGVLKITDEPTVGIAETGIQQERTYTVYSTDGRYLATIQATPATLRQKIAKRISKRNAAEAYIVTSEGESRKVAVK